MILSEDGMAALLGDRALDSLANYFAHSEDEKCDNLLSLEHSLDTLAQHKRKDAPDTHTSKPMGPPPPSF